MENLTTLLPDLNTVLNNVTSTLSPHVSHKSGPKYFPYVVKVVYLMGIIGNAVAIVILRRGERRVRNRKHLLLITSLAANDLVALVGMLTLYMVSESLPWIAKTQYYCAARVVLRVFGVGSVCIAVTMALERYLALTRPFFYQKQVTYYVIRTALLVSWFWAAALTCTPILGLGVYYNEDTKTCLRYREATTPIDYGYAVFYVGFGTLLCALLVYCNAAVIRALRLVAGGAPRRVSKSSWARRPPPPHRPADHPLHHHVHGPATAEEVLFSRLMATLSVLFMICWLPQMITSTLYLSLGPASWPRLSTLALLSDLLMLLNYVLDPVLYVLMRKSRRSFASARRSLSRCFRLTNDKSSTESIKASETTELKSMRIPSIQTDRLISFVEETKD